MIDEGMMADREEKEMDNIVEKAGVLIEALPYIRTFFGKTIVIKYGGSAMLNTELKQAVTQDIVLLKFIGLNPVIVHGGGPEISETMARMGKKARFANGLRVTDEETMDIVSMVLGGKVNKEIVSLINKHGGKAVGLSGKDANLIMAQKRANEVTHNLETGEEELVDLGYVGDIERINPGLIQLLCREGYIPVVATIGVGPSGESYNINADHVAGELACSLSASKLIMLTDVEGIYEEYGKPETLISSLSVSRAKRMIEEGKIEGGMIPKVEACVRAVEEGVPRTHIIDGRKMHSILLEIFTDHGIGTMVMKDGGNGEGDRKANGKENIRRNGEEDGLINGGGNSLMIRGGNSREVADS